LRLRNDAPQALSKGHQDGGIVTNVAPRFRLAPLAVVLGSLLLGTALAVLADPPPARGSDSGAEQEKPADKKPPPEKKEVKPATTVAPGTSSQDAGVIARERRRRCQLHPGTCVQGSDKGNAAHHAREQ